MSFHQALHRYPETYDGSSLLDPFEDITTRLQSLTSSQYTEDLLANTRHLGHKNARKRAKQIAPHVRTALHYVEQAMDGPREVAFLPIYYSMMNFAKVYILFGSHHEELAGNRWHGANYPATGPDAPTVLQDHIVLHKDGTFPLFYRTLTDEMYTAPLSLYLSDVYPFVTDVCGEYELATGKRPQLASLQFEVKEAIPFITATPMNGMRVSISDIRLFNGLQQDCGTSGQFRSPVRTENATDCEPLRPYLRPYLLYRAEREYRTPLSSGPLLLAEEFLIMALAFHMSSVVRYKPDLLAKFRDSTFWPVLLAAQRHCFLKFLVLCWSFTHRRAMLLSHGDGEI